jgi:hypothetical protein
MLAAKDPIAMELYQEYGQLAMPNMRLNRQEAGDLIEYLKSETARVARVAARVNSVEAARATASRVSVPKTRSEKSERSAQARSDEAVAVINAWVRETDEHARMNAGYMTLVNAGNEDIKLVKVESEAFDFVEVHEMAKVDGLMEMRELTALLIPANDRALLAPGGKHLMMSGPRKSLEKGERVDLVLTFDTGTVQTVSVHVVAM